MTNYNMHRQKGCPNVNDTNATCYQAKIVMDEAEKNCGRACSETWPEAPKLC